MPFALRHTFPWLLALSLGLFALALPDHASTFAPYFFLSSALLLGVPHGACDPWVPGWVLRHPSRLPFLIIFFIAYLSLSALYLFLWKIFPLPRHVAPPASPRRAGAREGRGRGPRLGERPNRRRRRAGRAVQGDGVRREDPHLGRR
ncbi:MAG: Brp/Blh family beta-carotene 15,15'-dioxygenase, partial [Aliarcobacter sp.]